MAENNDEPDAQRAGDSRAVAPEADDGTGAGQRPDPKLLELLVCPLTKATLTYERERMELVSKAAGLAYPIREGIPIMLPAEARQLEDWEAR